MNYTNDECKDPGILLCLVLDRHRPQRSFPSDHRELALNICANIDRASDSSAIAHEDVETRRLDLVEIDVQAGSPSFIWRNITQGSAVCRL